MSAADSLAGSGSIAAGRCVWLSALQVVGSDHAEIGVVIQRQLDPLTRAKAVQAGARHVPGDRPRRFVIVDQEGQTEPGQNLMCGRRNEGLIRLSC
jgi:hypothetical protein